MTFKFYDDEKVALFIDGANLYAAARALGFDIEKVRLAVPGRLNRPLDGRLEV